MLSEMRPRETRLRLFLALSFVTALAGCASTPAPAPSIPAAPSANPINEDALVFGVLDSATGQWLAQSNLDRPVVPASSIKSLTTYASLKILGADHVFHTELVLNDRGGKRAADLILKGGGDPTLLSSDLLNMAFQLRRAGIREVKGAFYYDDRVFIPSRVLSEDVDSVEPYNAPVSGLNVDFNQASDSGARRPLSDPSLVAAKRFARFVRAMGIRIREPLPIPAHYRYASSKLIHRHSSQTLDRLVRSTLEYSNNLLAESICLAAASQLLRKPVGIKDGAGVAYGFLSTRFKDVLPEGSWSLENCSGLTMGTRISAKQYASALRKILDDRELPVYFGSLLKFSGTGFNALAKSGGMDYHASLGGVIMTGSGAPKVFFIEYADPSSREKTRLDDPLRRKADAAEWGRVRRGEILKKLEPFLGVEQF